MVEDIYGGLSFDEDTTKTEYFDGKAIKPSYRSYYESTYSLDSEKMCRRDMGDMDRGDYYTETERTNTGGNVDVTYFSDGSFTTHHGGPCGPSYCDEYGREC